MQCRDEEDVYDIRQVGKDDRGQELDSLIGRISDDPATEWIDVKDLFSQG
jgi:hypothetical protein